MAAPYERGRDRPPYRRPTPLRRPPAIRQRDLEALVVAKVPLEASGADRTFLCVDAAETISMARLGPALEGATLKATFAARWSEPQTPGSCLHLIELDGFVAGEDARIDQALQKAAVRINRRIVLGAYAVPFAPEALAGPGRRTRDAGRERAHRPPGADGHPAL